MSRFRNRRPPPRKTLPRWVLPSLRRGLVVVPLLLVLGGLWWASSSGTIARWLAAGGNYLLTTSADMGWALHEVRVSGRSQTPPDALRTALAIELGAPLLAFDPAAAQIRIAALPWVREVTVQRLWPDRIHLLLTERVPLARWQHGGTVLLIDNVGFVLRPAKQDTDGALPLVVGAGADHAAASLLTALSPLPAIRQRYQAAVRVSDRRWDLLLADGLRVRLPAEAMPEALARLETLLADGVLPPGIRSLDLRLADRMMIGTEPNP